MALGLAVALAWGPIPDPAAALAAGAAATRPPADLPASLARLDSLLDVSATAEAVALGKNLLRDWGDDPLFGWQIQGRLGLALLRAAREDEALPHLEAAVQGNPLDADLHRNLGAALRGLGRRGRALTEYQWAVERDPDDFTLRLEYGRFLQEFGDLAGAQGQLQRGADLCRGCPEAAGALANLFLQREDYASAVAPLQAVRAVDSSPRIRRLLAIALQRSGRLDEVESLLLSVPPQDLEPDEHRVLVQVEAARGGALASHSLACADLLAAGPDALAPSLREDPAFWGQIAVNLLACGRFEAGLRAADRSVALAPDDPVLQNNRAALLLKLDRREEAAAAWERALALDPALADKEKR